MSNVVPVDPQTSREVLSAVGIHTPIWLPFPPSANSLWRAIQGRNIASQRYRQWKGHALGELMIQRPKKVHGPYRITIVATRPDRRPRDLGNLLKALEDALVTAGVVDDDSLAQSIWLRWSDAAPDKNGGVQVVVEAAS